MENYKKKEFRREKLQILRKNEPEMERRTRHKIDDSQRIEEFGFIGEKGRAAVSSGFEDI